MFEKAGQTGTSWTQLLPDVERLQSMVLRDRVTIALSRAVRRVVSFGGGGTV
jgi:hypothetical protein